MASTPFSTVNLSGCTKQPLLPCSCSGTDQPAQALADTEPDRRFDPLIADGQRVAPARFCVAERVFRALDRHTAQNGVDGKQRKIKIFRARQDILPRSDARHAIIGVEQDRLHAIGPRRFQQLQIGKGMVQPPGMYTPVTAVTPRKQISSSTAIKETTLFFNESASLMVYS